MGAFGSIASCGIDMQDIGTVKQPVRHGIDDRGISQGRAPLFDAYVRGYYQGGTVLAGIDQVQQEAWVFLLGADIVHIVQDYQVKL